MIYLEKHINTRNIICQLCIKNCQCITLNIYIKEDSLFEILNRSSFQSNKWLHKYSITNKFIYEFIQLHFSKAKNIIITPFISNMIAINKSLSNTLYKFNKNRFDLKSIETNFYYLEHFNKNNSNIELYTLGYPEIKEHFGKNSELSTIILKKNPNLLKLNTIVMMPIFTGYTPIFDETFQNTYFFRKKHLKIKSISKDQYTQNLFFEYIAWLNKINALPLNAPIYLNKSQFLEFILLYNERYYSIYKNNRILKNNILMINPFITYWIHCNHLREILELPSNTIFLPKSKIVDNLLFCLKTDNKI